MNLNEERIREFAYQIWQSEGKPHGHAKRHWEMACKLVESNNTPQSIAADSSKLAKKTKAKDTLAASDVAATAPAKKAKPTEKKITENTVLDKKAPEKKAVAKKAPIEKTINKVETKKPAASKKAKTIENASS